MSLIIARIFIAVNAADSISVRQTSINSGRPSKDLEFFHVDDPRIKRCLLVRHELRRASNKGTLRAFRNADRFTTFKIFRRPGALRRRVAPGQSGRSDWIGWPQWSRQINLVCAPPR